MVVLATLGMNRQVELDLMSAAELCADLAHGVHGRGSLYAGLADAHDLVALAGLSDRIERLFGRALQLVEKAHRAPLSLLRCRPRAGSGGAAVGPPNANTSSTRDARGPSLAI